MALSEFEVAIIKGRKVVRSATAQLCVVHPMKIVDIEVQLTLRTIQLRLATGIMQLTVVRKREKLLWLTRQPVGSLP